MILVGLSNHYLATDAAIRGARFNPKGVPALYLALDPMTAIKEANQGFAHKIEPCVICTYEINSDDLVDLRTEEARTRGRRSRMRSLSAPWFSFLAERKEPPQWALVRRSAEHGAAGALVLSFAVGARASDHNMVLWDWGATLPHRVLVFDPSGKLPKNQLSWE